MDAVSKLCNFGLLLENGLLTYQSDINSVVDKYLQNSSKSSIYENNRNDIGVYVSKISFVGTPTNQQGVFCFEESIKIQITIKRNNQYMVPQGCVLGIVLYQEPNKKICTNEFDIIGINKGDLAVLTMIYPPSLFSSGNYFFEYALHVPNVEMIENKNEICYCTILNPESSYQKYRVNQGVLSLNIKSEIKYY